MCHRIYGASKLDYDVLMPERTFNELQKGLEMAREAPLAVVSFEDSKSQLQAILKRYPRFFQVSKLNPGSKSKGRSSVKYITLNDTSAQLGVWYKEDPIFLDSGSEPYSLEQNFVQKLMKAKKGLLFLRLSMFGWAK
jgi:hypothetical protein